MTMMTRPRFENTGGRRADRVRFVADVQFRSGTRRAMVQVCDLSMLGARISGVFRVHPGDTFWITLPTIAPIEARVAWVNEFEFGCEFVRPLGQVVFDAISATI